MDDNVDILYPLVGRFDARRSPGAHDLGKQAKARIAALAKAEVFPIAVSMYVFQHLLRLPSRRVEHLDEPITVRHDVETVHVCKTIKPVIGSESPDHSVFDLVDAGTCPVEAANCPSGNFPGDWYLDGAALLGEAIKLQSLCQWWPPWNVHAWKQAKNSRQHRWATLCTQRK